MTVFRRLLCWASWHSGYVDGGFRCSYCSFFDPFTAEDHAAIDHDIAREIQGRRETPEMQLADDVKTVYPEQWQQDAILKAWRTGQTVVGRRPHE